MGQAKNSRIDPDFHLWIMGLGEKNNVSARKMMGQLPKHKVLIEAIVEDPEFEKACFNLFGKTNACKKYR